MAFLLGGGRKKPTPEKVVEGLAKAVEILNNAKERGILSINTLDSMNSPSVTTSSGSNPNADVDNGTQDAANASSSSSTSENSKNVDSSTGKATEKLDSSRDKDAQQKSEGKKGDDAAAATTSSSSAGDGNSETLTLSRRKSRESGTTQAPSQDQTKTPTPEEIKEIREALEEVQKRLADAKLLMIGKSESPPKKEEAEKTMKLLTTTKNGLVKNLIQKALSRLNFESRKDLVAIFSYLSQHEQGFAERCKDVVPDLVLTFSDKNVALHCGMMLRECFQHEVMVKQFLQSNFELLDKFFNGYLVTDEAFDFTTDAFQTLSTAIMTCKQVTLDFLNENHEQFFERLNALLHSQLYITQRQALKLLADILLERTYQPIMMKFIGNKENLKSIMTLMRVNSVAIQKECFHVFKVFVANPNKNDEIKGILFRNKQKLCTYLENLKFGSERQEEAEQIEQERQLVITTLKELEAPEGMDMKDVEQILTPRPSEEEAA